jgi:hypothetical protein
MKTMILATSDILLSCFTVLFSKRKELDCHCELIVCPCDMKETAPGIFVSKFTAIVPKTEWGTTVGMSAAAFMFSSLTSRTFLSNRQLLRVVVSLLDHLLGPGNSDNTGEV